LLEAAWNLFQQFDCCSLALKWASRKLFCADTTACSTFPLNQQHKCIASTIWFVVFYALVLVSWYGALFLLALLKLVVGVGVGVVVAFPVVVAACGFLQRCMMQYLKICLVAGVLSWSSLEPATFNMDLGVKMTIMLFLFMRGCLQITMLELFVHASCCDRKKDKNCWTRMLDLLSCCFLLWKDYVVVPFFCFLASVLCIFQHYLLQLVAVMLYACCGAAAWKR
jgi:hypothetical protein